MSEKRKLSAKLFAAAAIVFSVAVPGLILSTAVEVNWLFEWVILILLMVGISLMALGVAAVVLENS